MEQKEITKTRLIIYVLMAYGLTCLMEILMWYGSTKGYDLTVFPTAQMMYPAAGLTRQNWKSAVLIVLVFVGIYNVYLILKQVKPKLTTAMKSTILIGLALLSSGFPFGFLCNQSVRRHIVGGTYRTLISVQNPLRLCRTGICRSLSAG